MSAQLSGGKKIVFLVLLALVGLGMIASGVGKLVQPPPIVENFTAFRLLPYVTAIGILELVIAVLFLVPKTSSLGALLATGYFGGAVVAELSTGEVGRVVPALVLGSLVWVVNALRNPNMFESFKA